MTRPRRIHPVSTLAFLAAGLLAQAGVHPAEAQETSPLAGSWKGTLNAGGAQLPVIFHVKASAQGLAATMDSPAQGATGIPVSEVTLTGRSVVFVVQVAQGRFQGTLSEDGAVIEGTWSQGPASLPLKLERMAEGETVKLPPRPQEPNGPVPYASEDIRFSNREAGVELAGTLTLPRGRGPFPGVVLVSGSGPQDRNETLLGHKPFLVLADHLTRQGIAVLRFDDRGVAGSGGDFTTATSEDFASDALSAVEYLRARPEIAPDRVGIVGHSEGGLIAPLVATRSEDVAFIVLLAGPGVPGREIVLYQGELIARAGGASEEAIRSNRATQERIFDVVEEVHDPTVAEPRLRAILEEAAAGLPEDRREAAEASIDTQIRQVNSPWFRFFLTYDPRPTLERVRVPVLALLGERDLQVPDEQNAPEIRKALAAGGNPDATVTVLPGLNHLFQTAKTGSPAEYQGIEETMSPKAMSAVASWILERFGSAR